MNATRIIGILLLFAILVIVTGFFFTQQTGSVALGHKLIGVATLFIFLVLMPAFLVVRLKGKDLSKFTFQEQKKQDDEDEKW